MFNQEYAEAAVEVLDILDNTNKADFEKIPTSFVKFLVHIASPDYRVNLDHSKKINEMNLSKKTKELLGVIYINWWCSAEEKEGYKKQIKELEIKKQEELRQKYSVDNLFNNNSNTIKNNNASDNFEKIINETTIYETKTKNTQMVEYKEGFFKRIIKKIKNFFINR